jgi:hypothetical protein
VISAHPDALVRDQYLLEVSSRCRIDAGQLREQLQRPAAANGSAARAGERTARRERDEQFDGHERGGRNVHGRGEPDGRTAIDLRPVPLRRVAGSAAEHDALRCAVDDPDEALAWLDPVLFTEGPHRRAFEALVAWPTLAAALNTIEADDPDAADVLRQAAAEQSDATIGDVFLRLSQEAARRVLIDLKQEALHASDPLALSAELAHVASLHSTLMSDEAANEAKLQAGTDLLAWLLEPGEGMR